MDRDVTVRTGFAATLPARSCLGSRSAAIPATRRPTAAFRSIAPDSPGSSTSAKSPTRGNRTTLHSAVSQTCSYVDDSATASVQLQWNYGAWRKRSHLRKYANWWQRIRKLFWIFEYWLNKLNFRSWPLCERNSIWHIFVQIFQICDFDNGQLTLLCVVLSDISFGQRNGGKSGRTRYHPPVDIGRKSGMQLSSQNKFLKDSTIS